MATHTFSNLKRKYDGFEHPFIVLTINGKEMSKNKYGFVVSDIEVELTSGFEASIATFAIYNTFDVDNGCFRINDAKSYIMLGSSVEIALGYEKQAQNVFCGFISRVNFVYEEGEPPGIRITAMDVKGIMMANNYSRQIKAKSYGAAVREILNRSAYMSMSNSKIIKNIIVSDTPDKAMLQTTSGKASDRTIEMVAESDYEFVVKAAKKYNYEFFTECGNVYFRKAKSNAETIMEMGPADGLRTFDVEYDVTGLVETIMTRATDVGKAGLIESKQKFSNKISIGNKAKKLIKKTEKVYLDATITSKEEADLRAQSLMEEMSYRFGSLECDCIGMPEIMPGKFIVIKALGSPPENKFYIVRVVHKLSEDRGFETKIYGKVSAIEDVSGLGGVSGGLI